MNLKTWSWIFAIVFLAIGILGFVPGITNADGNLLGIFHVDTVHNIVHILTGAIALLVAVGSAKSQTAVFKTFGVIYAIVAIVGLVQGDTVLGIFAVNMADHVLHVAIALIALYLGFVAGKKNAPMPMQENVTPMS